MFIAFRLQRLKEDRSQPAPDSIRDQGCNLRPVAYTTKMIKAKKNLKKVFLFACTFLL